MDPHVKQEAVDPHILFTDYENVETVAATDIFTSYRSVFMMTVEEGSLPLACSKNKT